MKQSILAIMVAEDPCLGIVTLADEIQFTTLPETVQTTVIRETHIASPAGAVQVTTLPADCRPLKVVQKTQRS